MEKLNKVKNLRNNTIMLYLLTFSNYFFALATIPYQTRVLKPEIYGLVGFAMVVMMYFQLVIDFGFVLSATQHVAENHDNITNLRKITTSVLFAKIFLSLICLLAFIAIDLYIDILKDEILLFVLFFLHTAFNSLIPDYLYRGLENMKIITVRTVAMKAFFAVMILLFLKDNSQYCLIPLLYLLGSFSAVIWSYYDIYKRFNIYFVNIGFDDILYEIKESFPFFVSRIATTVYGASNVLILKSVYPSNIEIGYYTSSDKIVSVARSAASPIADSLYPYMVKNRDYRIIVKLLIRVVPIVVIGCAILWFYSVPICMFVFGSDYIEAGIVLKYMIPLMIMALPNYVLGFPALVPLGLSRIANMSNVIGAIIQVIGLGVLYFANLIDVYNLCIITSLSELSILVIRFCAVVYGIKKNHIAIGN